MSWRQRAPGRRLARAGLVDIAASQEPDGREVVNNIRYGVFVTFKAHSEYARNCFKQYGLLTDPSGWYASMWRPFHLIGLEATVSALYAVLRNEATGSSRDFRADAVATAKKDMAPGEMLDGEGGFAVWANAIPASRSLDLRALPIGLAHNVRLKRAIKKDQVVSYDGADDSTWSGPKLRTPPWCSTKCTTTAKPSTATSKRRISRGSAPPSRR